MSVQQFIEQFAVPVAAPYTYNLLHPMGATLVDVQSASGATIAGCSITAGVLTAPSAQEGSVLWVIYTATGAAYGGSKAQAGRGSSISIGAGPTLIGEVTSISLNRGKWQSVTVTNFQSGLDEELIQTIRKAGTVSIKGNRVSSDAGQALVEAAYQAGGLQPFVQQLPLTPQQNAAGDKFLYNAFVTSSDFTDDVDKEIQFTIELQISGAAPFTVGS
jgi:hypothetical protein